MTEVRLRQTNLKFMRLLQALSSSLFSGKSVENAFLEASNELKRQFAAASDPFLKELDVINKRVSCGISIEQALCEYADTSGSDDIIAFAEVFRVCKRSGGNMIQVMRRTAGLIGEKIQIEQEIYVLIAQKRLESRLLNIVPYVLITAIVAGSPDYARPLYEYEGSIVMSCALILIMIANFIAMRLMNIRV